MGYISKKVGEAGGYKDSLDERIYEAIAGPTGEAGLDFKVGAVNGPVLFRGAIRHSAGTQINRLLWLRSVTRSWNLPI